MGWARDMEGARACALVIAAVGAFAVTAPATAAVRESSSRFLAQNEIDLPARSTVIDSVDRRAGCGSTPSGGRFTVDGDPADWRGAATMVSGTGRYHRGEYIWTDYAFDDDGTGKLEYPGQGTPVVPAAGTAGRPSARQQRYGSNAADVIELRAALDQTHLYLMTRLNFVNATDATVLGLAFDTDANTATGTASWPRGARMKTPGTDLFVTAYGDCGYVQTGGREQTMSDAGGAVRMSTVHNVIELAIPRTLLGEGRRLRLAGGAGLWDPAKRAWMTPGLQPSLPGGNVTDLPQGASGASDPGVFNLLFRGDEGVSTGGPRSFQSAKQNRALKGGTSGGYAASLALDRLHAGAASDPPLLRRGTERAFTRLYRSRIDAEGVLVQGQYSVFLSRYQPYGIYLPDCFEAGCARWPSRRPPALAIVHGGSGSHVDSLPASSGGVPPLADITATFTKIDALFAPVVVAALGRGQRAPWWRGLGEADVLELREDAQRRYAPDRSRWTLTGGSLGGYSTMRLSSLYPDTWAGAFAHCPASYENSLSSRYLGHVVPESQNFVVDPLLPSLLNVPFRQANGTADPAVPVNTGRRLRDVALAAGLDYEYTEYLAGSHCFDYTAGLSAWVANHAPEYLALARTRRVKNPARVRYVVDPRHYRARPEPIGVFDIRDVGVRYEGAYWLSGLVVRDELVRAATAAPKVAAGGNQVGGAGTEVVASIDVASHALAGRQIEARRCGSAVGGGGALGGDPQLAPDRPTPNAFECQTQTLANTTAPRVELTTRGFSAVTIDTARAGLRALTEFEVDAVGDGALTLTLKAAGPRTVSGACVRQATAPGRDVVLRLSLSSTRCAMTVVAAGRSTST